VEDREVPEPGPDQVLIRTRRTLISTGTELTILSGEFPPESAWSAYGRFPFIPGYDNVGTVTELGEGVDRSWRGQRVGTYAAHAAWVTAPVAALRPIADQVGDEQAAFFTLAEIVMNGVRRGQVTWGEAVVIYGAGLLGQLAARFCRLAGARPVIVVDVSEGRLELLPQGVCRAQGKDGEVVESVAELTRGRMADVVFEVTGIPELVPEEFQVLRPQGRMVVLSSPRGSSAFDFHDLCNAPSYTIIGAHNSSHPPLETPGTPWTQQRHAALFFDLLSDGAMEVSSLISHRVPFRSAPQVYQMLLRDRTQAMGVLLEWD
jgi:2-desacetyl-2-hydroxyethyl bacteriochlorophyllide A dehydrogenase